jgi:hypothetical protein
MRQDLMRIVAGRAGRAHAQALFKEPLSVDAFRIIFKDVVLVDLPLDLDRKPLKARPWNLYL